METNGEHLSKKQFARAVRDLERITRQVATRYIELGVPLTWRLLHAIEAEAVADLGFAGRGRHEAALRALFAGRGRVPAIEKRDC
ncbi:Serine/threonine protein kinase [Candidatus Paraburkholderia calva]|nr:Serine/threonine protein kinase [Candidatus Paraburkholderia calva]